MALASVLAAAFVRAVVSTETVVHCAAAILFLAKLDQFLASRCFNATELTVVP